MSSFSGRGLHGQVVAALGRRIIRGQLQPGEHLDPEALMSEFGISRTVVRESLKVLAAKGLIDARPKIGTYVTDRSSWQLLDVDVMQWRTEDHPDPRLVIELDQIRSIIEPAAFSMAAAQRTEAQLEQIAQALDRMVTCFDQGDGEGLVEADIAFHLAVLAASDNELLAQFEVVLEPALRARHTLASRHATDRDFLDSHRAMFDAIQSQDPEAARERTARLMERSLQEIAAILKG